MSHCKVSKNNKHEFRKQVELEKTLIQTYLAVKDNTCKYVNDYCYWCGMKVKVQK
jgi:hypothetical protein